MRTEKQIISIVFVAAIAAVECTVIVEHYGVMVVRQIIMVQHVIHQVLHNVGSMTETVPTDL
jgi:hypothetical protein